MIRLNSVLCGLIVTFGVAHAGYSFLGRAHPTSGSYFSSGLFLMSDGSSTPVSIRMQLKNNSLYEYIQVGAWYQDYLRDVDVHLAGNYKLKNISSNSSKITAPPSYSDEDIVFNNAYSIKPGNLLTLYTLPHDKDTLCFYIKELNKAKCFGQNRSREFHP